MGVKRFVKHSRHSVKHAVKRNVVAADLTDFTASPRRRSRRPHGGAIALAYGKDTLRSWLRSWKRFLSIAVICLLGVSVLTGIYAGCRDMFMAADRFYDEQGLHDIQVLSTYGLTDDDVMALRRIDGVDVVQPDRTQSATTDVGGTDKSVTMTEIGVVGLDQPYLQEGRMPAKAGEPSPRNSSSTPATTSATPSPSPPSKPQPPLASIYLNRRIRTTRIPTRTPKPRPNSRPN